MRYLRRLPLAVATFLGVAAFLTAYGLVIGISAAWIVLTSATREEWRARALAYLDRIRPGARA